MNREGHKNAKFFVGPEVEHTPAFSKRTLFVVGKQKLEDIERLARENRTTHIFMGANHSFNSNSEDPYWNTVITSLLDKGFWVTLDYQAHEHETVLKMLNPGIWQSRIFVPLLGVRIPKVQTSSPNLTIKIDDIDFNATNDGVWCAHHHEITDSNRFTPWSEYRDDAIIGDTEPITIDPGPTGWAGPLEILASSITEPVTTDTTVKNDQSIGLDTNSSETVQKTVIIDAAAAAEAYAAGAKEDPLAKEASKKPKNKKAE